MANFKIHTLTTAPDNSKVLLESALKQNGFIPNLYGIMAESPELLKAYRQMSDLFNETSFNSIEKNIIWLTVSNHNMCHYCMAIHTHIAKLYKLNEKMIEALRNNKSLDNPKYEILRQFIIILVEKRGWATDDDIQSFLSAGYTQKNVLELLLGIGQKIISNYVNHITHTPLDKKAEDFKWEAPDRHSECK